MPGSEGSRPSGVKGESEVNLEMERLLGDAASSLTPNYYFDLGSLPAGHTYTRLLRLHPAADHERDAPLSARLDIINLQSPHVRFEALSYVWGRDTVKGGIQLLCQAPDRGGYFLAQADITANLAVALKHLRYRNQTRILWVDAICINQNDVAEKTSQVGLMSTIYRQADRVLIWMGPAQHGSDWVLKHVNDLSEQARAAKHDKNLVDNAADVPSPGNEQASDPTPPPAVLTDEETFAFAQLLNREWYTRVWVIQELCVAKEAVVICGDSSTPWEAIFPTFQSVFGSAASGQPSSALNYGMARHAALSRLRLLTAVGSLLALEEALVRCQWSRASSPVDKVYALLGICKDEGIIPDYSVSPEECFTLVARTILAKSPVPELLDFVVLPASTKRNKLLPSWVPDWSPENVTAKIEVAQSLADTFRLEQQLNSTETQDAPIGVSRPRFRGASTLILRGIEVDTVTVVNKPIPGQWLGNAYAIEAMDGPPAPEGGFFFREQVSYIKASWKYLVHNFRFLVTVARKVVDYASTMAHIDELSRFARQNPNPENAVATLAGDDATNQPITRLANLLISNTKALQKLSNREATQALLPPLEMTSRAIPRLYRALYFHTLLPSIIYHATIAIPGIYDALLRNDNTYTHAINSVGHLTPYIGMRMGLSRGRRFLCLTPHTCRAGDKIMLVGGGRHPYIFRRTGEDDRGDTRWVLVGPCYVESEEMDGLRKLWVEGDARDLLID